MAMRFSDIDPFADSLDGLDSIGADHDCIDTDGSLLYEETVIGKAQKKKAKFNVSVAARKAANTAKDIDNAIDKVRGVTRSPVTLAAIAATATIVPAGTIVAGVATAGLAIAEGVMAVAQPIAKLASKAGNFVKGLFGQSDKQKAAKVRARRLAAVAKLRMRNPKLSQEQAEFIYFKDTISKAPISAEMKAQLIRGAEAKLPKSKAQLKKEIDERVTKASKMIAKMMILAERGNKEAQAALAAFQILAQPDNIKNSKQMKTLKGATSSQAKTVLNVGYEEKFLALAIKKALKLKKAVDKKSPPPAKTKKANAAIQRKVRAVAKASSAKLKKVIGKKKSKKTTQAITTTSSGILVLPSRKTKKGNFRKGRGSTGWLVDAKGHANRGVWG